MDESVGANHPLFYALTFMVPHFPFRFCGGFATLVRVPVRFKPDRNKNDNVDSSIKNMCSDVKLMDFQH